MIKNRILALKQHLKIKSDKELALFFGLNETLIYSWNKHGKITQTGKILAKLPYLSLEWLETGHGPMILRDEVAIEIDNEDQCGSEVTTAKIEPKAASGKDLPQKEKPKKTARNKQLSSQSQTDAVTDDFKISDMLAMTAAVLESKDVYRTALASNVRALYTSIQMEDEMGAVTDQMTAMQEEFSAMREEMRAIKEMLLKFAGAEEKRDPAINS